MSLKLENAVNSIRDNVDLSCSGELILKSTDGDNCNHFVVATLYGDRIELVINDKIYTFVEE